jgi:hypothetical protein
MIHDKDLFLYSITWIHQLLPPESVRAVRAVRSLFRLLLDFRFLRKELHLQRIGST